MGSRFLGKIRLNGSGDGTFLRNKKDAECVTYHIYGNTREEVVKEADRILKETVAVVHPDRSAFVHSQMKSVPLYLRENLNREYYLSCSDDIYDAGPIYGLWSIEEDREAPEVIILQ